MKILGKLLLTLASLAYPLLWYYGRENGAFFWLAAAMCVLWLIRAAMPQTTAQRITAIILATFFRCRTGFQTARLDVLVSRRRQRADACRFRWQPVCQTNGYRTPRPTATPPTCRPKVCCIPVVLRKSGARSLSSTAQPPPFLAGLQYYEWWGGLYRHRVVCINGNLICRRVDLSEIGF